MTIATKDYMSAPISALSVARNYLRWPRVLLLIGLVAAGLAIGVNWTWLVAIGIASVLLSTLPCLVVCGLGVCVMCFSRKEAVQRGEKAPSENGVSASPLATNCCSHAREEAANPERT